MNPTFGVLLLAWISAAPPGLERAHQARNVVRAQLVSGAPDVTSSVDRAFELLEEALCATMDVDGQAAAAAVRLNEWMGDARTASGVLVSKDTAVFLLSVATGSFGEVCRSRLVTLKLQREGAVSKWTLNSRVAGGDLSPGLPDTSLRHQRIDLLAGNQLSAFFSYRIGARVSLWTFRDGTLSFGGDKRFDRPPSAPEVALWVQGGMLFVRTPISLDPAFATSCEASIARGIEELRLNSNGKLESRLTRIENPWLEVVARAILLKHSGAASDDSLADEGLREALPGIGGCIVGEEHTSADEVVLRIQSGHDDAKDSRPRFSLVSVGRHGGKWKVTKIRSE